MKRMITGVSLVAAMLLTASSAMAAGLNLAWTLCHTDGGANNKTLACANNLSAPGTIVGSFNTDTDILAATGIEFIVDLIANDVTLPQWWLTSCQARFSVNSTVGTATNCFDWATGTAAGGLAAYTPNYQYGVNTARIFGAFAVPPAGVDVVALPAATGEYFAFNIVMNAAKTSGTGNCAGCLTPVCLVFNNLKMVKGTQDGVILGTPETPGSNVITWQGAGANCAAVPTKNQTWSQVKALYR